MFHPRLHRFRSLFPCSPEPCFIETQVERPGPSVPSNAEHLERPVEQLQLVVQEELHPHA
jgi:hypothetical protein